MGAPLTTTAVHLHRWMKSWFETGVMPHGWVTRDQAPRCAFCGQRLTSEEARTAKKPLPGAPRPVPWCAKHRDPITAAVEKVRGT